jgi:galactokinase
VVRKAKIGSGALASAYAPGRVELLGNHTDYNEGVVLAAAIDRGIKVSGSRRDGELIQIRPPNSVGQRRKSLLCNRTRSIAGKITHSE